MTVASHSANRVPFGLLQATGLLVDVSEVPRGAASGCMCPSCRLPLVARHGDQHAWHFAHETRGVTAPVRECDYSLWVAVRLMALQILQSATTVRLPPFVIREFGARAPRGGRAIHEATVTAGGVVTAEQVATETTFEGLRCDALLHVGPQHHLALCLHHPERPLPDIPDDRDDGALRRVGFVAIDLDPVWAAVPTGSGTAARNGLQRIILDDVIGKKWLRHPREDRVRRELRAGDPIDPRSTGPTLANGASGARSPFRHRHRAADPVPRRRHPACARSDCAARAPRRDLPSLRLRLVRA